MCVGRVIALYFAGHNNHCYTEEPIANLNDLSYILLSI